MEFFTSKRTNQWKEFEKQLKLQRTTELDTLRNIKDVFEETGEDSRFLVKSIRQLGTFPLHEDYTLQRMVQESRQDAQMYGDEEPELFEQYSMLTSVDAIASLKISLENPGLKPEQKTLLKEAAQLQVYNVSGVMTDEQYDILLEYLDSVSEGVTGIDFTDQTSIDAALASIES